MAAFPTGDFAESEPGGDMGTVEVQPLKTAKQMVGRKMMVAFFILSRSMAISLAVFLRRFEVPVTKFDLLLDGMGLSGGD